MLGLLDRLHDAAVDAGRHGSLLEIRILQALAHHSHGDLPQAVAALGVALAEAPEPNSYVRLYLDEGARCWPSCVTHPASLRPVANMAQQCRSTPDDSSSERRRQPRPTSRQPLLDPLSQRELQVLRLLDSDLTGPQIARELYVSLNTLRTHTKRIFTKLDVKTRAAAVRRAHERGLL